MPRVSWTTKNSSGSGNGSRVQRPAAAPPCRKFAPNTMPRPSVTPPSREMLTTVSSGVRRGESVPTVTSDHESSTTFRVFTLSISARQSLSAWRARLPESRSASRPDETALAAVASSCANESIGSPEPSLGCSTVPSGKMTESGMAVWPWPPRLANSKASVARSKYSSKPWANGLPAWLNAPETQETARLGVS